MASGRRCGELGEGGRWAQSGPSPPAAVRARQLPEQPFPQLPALLLRRPDDVQHDLVLRAAGGLGAPLPEGSSGRVWRHPSWWGAQGGSGGHPACRELRVGLGNIPPGGELGAAAPPPPGEAPPLQFVNEQVGAHPPPQGEVRPPPTRPQLGEIHPPVSLSHPLPARSSPTKSSLRSRRSFRKWTSWS